MELNRRDFLKGIGAAAATAGVAGAAIASAEEAPAEEAEGAEAAADVSYADFNAFVKSTLRMDCDVIGIKFYESHDDVPAEAVHPVADMGKHMATCQALSLARYNGQTICMSAEDEWCWAPLVGYGIVDCSEGTEAFDTIIQYLNIADMDQAARFYAEEYPRLELGKYAAWVIGPLSTITYEPDVVMVYGDPFAINWLCLNAQEAPRRQDHRLELRLHRLVRVRDGQHHDAQDYQICFPTAARSFAPAPSRATRVLHPGLQAAAVHELRDDVWQGSVHLQLRDPVRVSARLHAPALLQRGLRDVGTGDRRGLGSGIIARKRCSKGSRGFEV